MVQFVFFTSILIFSVRNKTNWITGSFLAALPESSRIECLYKMRRDVWNVPLCTFYVHFFNYRLISIKWCLNFQHIIEFETYQFDISENV